MRKFINDSARSIGNYFSPGLGDVLTRPLAPRVGYVAGATLLTGLVLLNYLSRPIKQQDNLAFPTAEGNVAAVVGSDYYDRTKLVLLGKDGIENVYVLHPESSLETREGSKAISHSLEEMAKQGASVVLRLDHEDEKGKYSDFEDIATINGVSARKGKQIAIDYSDREHEREKLIQKTMEEGRLHAATSFGGEFYVTARANHASDDYNRYEVSLSDFLSQTTNQEQQERAKSLLNPLLAELGLEGSNPKVTLSVGQREYLGHTSKEGNVSIEESGEYGVLEKINGVDLIGLFPDFDPSNPKTHIAYSLKRKGDRQGLYLNPIED